LNKTVYRDQINKVAREFIIGLRDSRHPLDIAYDQLQTLVEERRPVELSFKPDPINELARSFYGNTSPDTGGVHNLKEVFSRVDDLILSTFPRSLDKGCFGDPVNDYAMEHLARSTPNLSGPIQTKESFYSVVQDLLGPHKSPLLERSLSETIHNSTPRPDASVPSEEPSDFKDGKKQSAPPVDSQPTPGMSQPAREPDSAEVDKKINSRTIETQTVLERVRDLTKIKPGRPGSIRVLHRIVDATNPEFNTTEVLEATREEVQQLREKARPDEHFTTGLRGSKIFSMLGFLMPKHHE
jgi:hypothetical protein